MEEHLFIAFFDNMLLDLYFRQVRPRALGVGGDEDRLESMVLPYFLEAME